MPSSSLFLRSNATLLSVLSVLSSLVLGASSTYVLDTEFSGTTFFEGFDFFDTADPTHGFVTYVDEATAQSDGLIKAGASTYIGVDYTHKYNGSADYYNINGVGRPSVRVQSQQSWTHGLFIADITHMPGGICGTWPALWTVGPNWPNNGEIDIIEGANNQNKDLSSTHTGGVCTIAGSPSTMTGTLQTNNCDVNPNDNTVGCGIEDVSTQSYGTGFNAIDGGVYAMEWTSAAITIWFFPRKSIPSDISSGNTPNPANWGEPDAIFNGPDCSIDSNFASNSLIIDTTFCGDFAGATWADAGGCASLTGQASCSVYVGNNPSVFKNAYWEFNYVKVFQAQAVSTTSSSTHTSTTSSSTHTSTTTVRSRSFMPDPSTSTTGWSNASTTGWSTASTTGDPPISTTGWSTDSTSYSSSSSTTGTVTSGWPVSTLMGPAMGGGVDISRAGPFGVNGYAWGPTTTATATSDDGTTTSTATPTWTWPTTSTATPTWTWTTTSSVPTTLTAGPIPASTPANGVWATAATTPVNAFSTTGSSTWVANATTPSIATYTGAAARTVGGGMTWFVTAIVAGGVTLLL